MKKRENVIQSLSQRAQAERMPEKGQTIVILAAALIVLIGFVGLAVDLGYIWMRQTQLRTIVDAAALAGAPELGTSEGIVPADARAIQYLATNQIMETYGQIDLDQLTSFQSGQSRSTLGALEYTITVTWQVELFFMTVLGFDTVNITESSTAGYFPLVDLYAGLRVARNGVTTSTQAIFGPEQQTSFGDAFSNPSSPFLNQFNLVDGDTGDFRYQYRVEIPPGYKGFINTGSETGDSLLETNIVRIELLDPDSINRTMPDGTRFQYSRAWIDHLIEEGYSAETISEALSNSDCSDTRIYQPCVISTCEWSEDNCTREGFIGYNHNTNPFDETDINPFWYYRLDELRRPGGSTTSQEWGTATVYTLYYFQRMADGTIQRRNLASYVGQSGASNYASFNNQPIGTNHYSTDLKWVSPGAYNKIDGDVRLVPTRCEANMTNGGFLPAPGTCGETSGDEDATATQAADVNSWGRGFEVNIVTDLPGIVVDASSQMRYLYVDVKSIDGASENGFEIWAGPPYAHYVEGWQDVNQRNVLVTNEPNVYTTQGVSAYSVGIMPLNSLTNNRVDFPLVYVKPEFAGQNVEISLFDADSGVSYPLCFYFDTIPNPDCNSSYNNSGIDGYLVYYDEANDGNRCFPSCNNQFVTPSFTVQVPDFDQTSCNPNAATLDEKMFVCNEFLGGRLIVSYDGGQHDTYQWLVTFPSVPYLVR